MITEASYYYRSAEASELNEFVNINTQYVVRITALLSHTTRVVCVSFYARVVELVLSQMRPTV